MSADPRREVRRQATSIALAVAPFGLAFGVAAADAGLAVWQASAFSALVFSGSAQLAAVGVLGDGGGAAAAVAAGLLLNLRSLAFGVVMAPALGGPRWRRAAESQLMIDEAVAVGTAQADREWRRRGYLAAGLGVFLTWNVATLAGAAALSTAGDAITAWGVDATIPAAFLALLWPRLRRGDQARTAAAGALVALALTPIAPPGLPIIAAVVGVAAGWRGAEARR